MPATELATIDDLKEREAGTGEEEVKVGLLDRWADSTPTTRQISKVKPCTHTTLSIATVHHFYNTHSLSFMPKSLVFQMGCGGLQG